MSDYQYLVDKLLCADHSEDIDHLIGTNSDSAANDIRDRKLKVVEYIKTLNPVLTNGSYEIRSQGVKLLTQVITKLPRDLLVEKEIESLTEFFYLRLIDHKSMEQAALRCLTYFVDCNNKPYKYNKQVVEFLKTKANTHRMEARTRYRVYELLKKIVLERRRMSSIIDGDFIYSLVSIFEGENNPDNLLLCFSIISFILKNFSDLEPFIDDIFEWLSSYYPVDYTPMEKDCDEAVNIQRSDLVEALYDCFYSTPLNSENLLTLLLDKLDSNVFSSKIESLECLIKCYQLFPLDTIKKYNSTLWTAIRMNCLKKTSTMDHQLFMTSLRTLEALANRLVEDTDLYFTFISDMYEELAIAFRKPEMDLFEPAAKLLAHSMVPSVRSFNYVLEKVIPTSINALNANELRPLSGLAYMFEQLINHHPDARSNLDFRNHIKDLLIKITGETVMADPAGLRLLEALICLRIDLEEEDMQTLSSNLQRSLASSRVDIERCLALLCLKYERHELIGEKQPPDFTIASLIDMIEPATAHSNQQGSSESVRFSIYLRALIIECDRSKTAQLDDIGSTKLSNYLNRLRDIATTMELDENDVEKIAILHAIILNKLTNDKVNPIVMPIFGSSFCQNLVPDDENGRRRTLNIYIPVIKWIFKALAVRNHLLATPIINLLLNFITANGVDPRLALAGAEVFGFLHAEDDPFKEELHYQRFSLYKQKYYMLIGKEIRIRIEKTADDDFKRSILLCALAFQIPHLPKAAYKRDYDWLIRHYIKALTSCKVSGIETGQARGDGSGTGAEEQSQCDDILFEVLFSCLEELISRDYNEQLVYFLPSLIELSLDSALSAKFMRIRKQALNCLTKISMSFKEADLLVFKVQVVDRLRACLTDKKRLVRQAAAEARLRWAVIGQPIGPSV